MTIIDRIYCKYALIGPELNLTKNILINIDETGKIIEIEPVTSQCSLKAEYSFPHHLMIPKFINAHVHLGDAVLKDQVFELTLNEAVGLGGYKYKTNNVSKSKRISAMRTALIEMIKNGISTCYDFREGSIQGIFELKEAANNLPIDVRILGRPDNLSELDDVIEHCDGLGLSTPNVFSKEELIEFNKYLSLRNVLVAIHIGEEYKVIKEAICKFGISDLEIALKYLKPDILIHLTACSNNDLCKIPSSKFIVFCPRSNAYFGLGFPPVVQFFNNKSLVGLGTDNVMTMNPNILEELKWLILRLKEKNSYINPIQALKFITSNPSEALNLETGFIKTDYWADLLVLNLKSYRTQFSIDPIKAMIFRSYFPEDFSLNLFHGEIISNEID